MTESQQRKSPREVIAENRAKMAAQGVKPIEHRALRTIVVNPDYTKQLAADSIEYASPNINCWKCETQINLENRPYTWTIGQLNYHFQDIPTYRCEPCNINYFPDTVRVGMVEKIDQLDPVWQPKNPIKRSPLAQAYYDRYGPPENNR